MTLTPRSAIEIEPDIGNYCLLIHGTGHAAHFYLNLPCVELQRVKHYTATLEYNHIFIPPVA